MADRLKDPRIILQLPLTTIDQRILVLIRDEKVYGFSTFVVIAGQYRYGRHFRTVDKARDDLRLRVQKYKRRAGGR